jgi:hypothetical protein
MEAVIVSANFYRHQLESKRKQRIDAEKRVGEYRTKKVDKRSAATNARAAAANTKMVSTANSKLREAGRREDEANEPAMKPPVGSEKSPATPRRRPISRAS